MTSTRTSRRLIAAAVALVVGAAPLMAPTAASAAYVQYASNRPTTEVTPVYSAVATIRGGKGYAGSNLVRTYVQTVSGGVLIASAFADSGNIVTMSHPPYSGAQSRCYWDFVGSSITSSVLLNCWRLA